MYIEFNAFIWVAHPRLHTFHLTLLHRWCLERKGDTSKHAARQVLPGVVWDEGVAALAGFVLGLT